ncbi:MAG: MMPL family transporter, partial [Desulfobacterales bacterium]|nr:MMPL family transporter [Desulfobacterales bacterium]
PEFFFLLKQVHDELFFLEGVNRAQVSSLFSPSTRFIEVVEDGFSGGPVIPADFKPDMNYIELVRQNTIKAGVVGRLIANDFSCAMVSAQLLEKNPKTGARLNYIQFAKELEAKIRDKYQTDTIRIHIIGFAKMIGDIAEGAKGVVLFFGIAILISFVLVYIYSLSVKLSLIPILCSFIAVIWQLGLLRTIGFGIDPMAILVPFLVFAIGVSHGMQMINSMGNQVCDGLTSLEAAHITFRNLLIPGGIALLSDAVGFLTLLLIKIGMIQELAINASLGVGVIIFTNLVLLPVIMSYLSFDKNYKSKKEKSTNLLNSLWDKFVPLSRPQFGSIIIILSLLILAWGWVEGQNMKIGDLHAGAPALHQDSRYNLDTALIVEKFSIGVDVISIIVETIPNATIDYEIMNAIDQFQWHLENVDGVQSTLTLSSVSKIINAGFNEGTMKWRVLSQNTSVLSQATSPIPSSSGLLNSDGSVMPIIIFLKDHKAETIQTVINSAKAYIAEHQSSRYQFKLCSGPVGVMAAQNEAVTAAQVPMLVWVYGVVIFLCIITFRSVKAVFCVIAPLVVVSVLAQAMMSVLKIGLTVSTLPIFALGAGIGVDYGIYIITPMLTFLRKGTSLVDAYAMTLKTTGSAVMFTGLTLAVGVSTWIFSALKFQVDIGILLTFMFLLNMLGAIVLLPALASWAWFFEQRKLHKS